MSSYFHHTGEELFYRGTQGSGTIFFTSCNMRCAFCQNGDISTDKDNGEETDPRTLAAMAWMALPGSSDRSEYRPFAIGWFRPLPRSCWNQSSRPDEPALVSAADSAGSAMLFSVAVAV